MATDEERPDAEPTDEAVVETAAEAAEGLVLDRLRTSDVDDLDITVTFEDGVLDVDVYLDASDADADLEQVANDAALAAQGAVDDLFADES
jgi:fructose 1,6-bisphosphatase